MAENPTLLPWEALDEMMTSGSFGSPPTDNNTRDRLFTFKQRMYSGYYTTPKHISKLLSTMQEALHRPDDHTLIWFTQRELH